MLDSRGPLPGGPPRKTIVPSPARGGDSNYDRIKDAVDIRDYLARYTSVEISPRTLRGCCPVHPNSDNSSIFLVNPERRSAHCFKCGFDGDVIDLHMARTGLSDWETLQELAEAFGVEIIRGRSEEWHASAGARAGALAEMEAAPVRRLADRLYRQYCLDYVRRLPNSTDDERRRKREDANTLWRTSLRQARALYAVGGEVDADAS